MKKSHISYKCKTSSLKKSKKENVLSIAQVVRFQPPLVKKENSDLVL